MDTATALWVLAATLFAGIHLFLQRVVARQNRSSALNGAFMYGLSGMSALVLLMVFYMIPTQWQMIGVFGIASGVIHAIGNFYRIESLKFIDSVIFFPINKMLGPFFVVVGGVWWFADALSWHEYVGVALSMTVPLLLISSVEHHRQVNLRQGLILLIISTFFTSVGVLVTKQGLTFEAAVLYMMAVSQLSGALTSLAIFFRDGSVRADKYFGVNRGDLTLGVVSGALAFAGFFTLLKALSTGAVSLVYVIHAHYILIPIILSVWWYGEHINTRKVIAVLISLLAITLLV